MYKRLPLKIDEPFAVTNAVIAITIAIATPTAIVNAIVTRRVPIGATIGVAESNQRRQRMEHRASIRQSRSTCYCGGAYKWRAKLVSNPGHVERVFRWWWLGGKRSRCAPLRDAGR